LGQLVDLWMACSEKSELLEALLPCSATMTHGSVSCCAQPCRVGWLASGVLCLASRRLSFLYILISFVFIERSSSYLYLKKSPDSNRTLLRFPSPRSDSLRAARPRRPLPGLAYLENFHDACAMLRAVEIFFIDGLEAAVGYYIQKVCK